MSARFSLLLCDGKGQVIHRGGSSSTSSCTTKIEKPRRQKSAPQSEQSAKYWRGGQATAVVDKRWSHCPLYQVSAGGGLDARPPFAARPVDASSVWGKVGAGHARVCCRSVFHNWRREGFASALPVLSNAIASVLHPPSFPASASAAQRRAQHSQKVRCPARCVLRAGPPILAGASLSCWRGD